jgi:hypothetical protein
MSVSLASAEKLKSITPDKTVREAQSAVEELETFSGDALIKQQARVKELLAMDAKQTAEAAWCKSGAGASQIVHSVGGTGGMSQGQASSPHPTEGQKGVSTSNI